MIFDLRSGKRRRVVQIVFSVLALIFVVGFLGFGIGGETGGGGILDALGIGGDSSHSSNTQYEEQIEDAEAKLETDPEDQQALLDLVRYYTLSATATGVQTDPQTGQTTITEGSRSDLEKAASAWQDYLELDPQRTNAAAAASAVQAYRLLLDAGGAAEAQRVVAEGQKTTSAYGQLAYFLYADFRFAAGDAAARQAVATADAGDREAIEKSLSRIAEQAREQKKLADKAAAQGGKDAGEAQLTDPFGALGGGAGSSAPPPAP